MLGKKKRRCLTKENATEGKEDIRVVELKGKKKNKTRHLRGKEISSLEGEKKVLFPGRTGRPLRGKWPPSIPNSPGRKGALFLDTGGEGKGPAKNRVLEKTGEKIKVRGGKRKENLSK